MVWRRLSVPSITSLATLHQAIQIVNNWDDDYLHRFHIYAVDYGISYSGGLSFRANAFKVYVDDFEFSPGDKFFYEYNFFEHHIVDIRIETIDEKPMNNKTIFCIKGNGMPGISKQDEFEAKYNLLRAIAKSNAQTTVGDILPFIEALRATRFERKAINQRLSAELTN